MRAAVIERPRILHATPGRVRVHFPGGPERTALAEDTLRRLPGVTSVRSNPLTGNVLIHFDPRSTNPDALLLDAGRIVPEASGPVVPAGRSWPAPAPAARITRAGTALGLGLLTANRLAGRRNAAGVALLGGFPMIRAALRRLLGPGAAELLFLAAELLSTTPLGLALAGVELLLLLLVLLGLRPEPTTPLLTAA